jgi:aminotransferase in exopolysaccharide biosynthesis
MIPLSIPELSGNEWKYVKDCLDTGWVSMAGAYVNKFERSVAHFCGADYGIATVNGTAALHISLMLAGVRKNDLVIVPNITFVASVNAIKYIGADPILIDINPNTWQMNLDLLEEFLEREVYCVQDEAYLTESKRRIRAIMPVHVLGNMCNMERLVALGTKYNIEVVEDATESLGSTYNGQHAGTFGTLGCFSFNGNKIITTGGGGVIVTNDKELAIKAKHLTTQAKIHPEEYIHDEIGYNYRLVNVLAAIGLAQMEQLPSFILKKKKINKWYREQLDDVGDIDFQTIEPQVGFNAWLITIRTAHKDMLLKYLNSNGVMCRSFWMPMNQLEMFENDIYVTEHNSSNKIYHSCLSIPSSTGLTNDQLNEVVNTIKQAFSK